MVSFVVLHYGDIHVTKMCTDSILQLDREDEISIIIVDNDYQKTEPERELLAQQYAEQSEVNIIKIREDIGFSKANNAGYAYAKKKYNPDFIVVTNNDIVFIQRDFAKRLQDIYDNSPYEILGPDVVGRDDGRHQSPIDVQGRSIMQVNYTIWLNAICLKLFPVVYPLLQINYDRAKNNAISAEVKARKCNIVPCGACIVFSKSFIEKEEKAFSPETHFYYEEYILYEKCLRLGYRLLFVPEVMVIHGDGIATTERAKNRKKRMRFVMTETLEAARIYREFIRNR